MLLKRLLKLPICVLDRSMYSLGIRSTHRLTLPNFLGLGPGQSGTTWLFKNLSKHPDIFMPEMKEVHYFSRKLHEWPLSNYVSLFEEGQDKVTGEISPGYSILRYDRIAFIHKIMPEVRLILILRNPIERSWSAARRVIPKIWKTFENVNDTEFYEYLRKEWEYRPKNGLRLTGDYEPGLLEGNYCKAIDNWLSFFRPEQLLILFFDELKENPKEFLRKVCDHIGASTDFEWRTKDLHEAVNRNPQQSLPKRFRSFLENMYDPEIVELHKRFGEPVNKWLN